MKYTPPIPARQYSTRNRRRHSRLKRAAVILTLAAACVAVWACVARAVIACLLNL